MYPVQITNHVEQSKNLLLSQFKNSPNILKWLEIYGGQLQQLEIEYFNLLDSLGIESAVDYGLDLIGKEVGELRQGKNDADYRDAIITRIFINNSSGTPEEVIAATIQITKADTVKYSEQYPAGVVLEIIGADYLPKVPIIKKTLPAAVDLIFDNNLDIDTATSYLGAAFTVQVQFESNPVYGELLEEGYLVNTGILTDTSTLYTIEPHFVIGGYLIGSGKMPMNSLLYKP